MSRIIPTLRYRDPRAAMKLLCEAFGFEEHAVHAPDGPVEHAELRLGDDFVMLGQSRGEDDRFPSGPVAVYIVVDDPDAHHDRAQKAGAEIWMPLTDQDYGSREYAARDGEGNVWSFGTYAPSVG